MYDVMTIIRIQTDLITVITDLYYYGVLTSQRIDY